MFFCLEGLWFSIEVVKVLCELFKIAGFNLWSFYKFLHRPKSTVLKMTVQRIKVKLKFLFFTRDVLSITKTLPYAWLSILNIYL